jgi:hypothetical protein
VILGLEAQDFWGITHIMTGLNKYGSAAHHQAGIEIISLSAVELNHKSNYQDFGRYLEADLAITSDPEAMLPELIEAVKKQITRIAAVLSKSAGRRSESTGPRA